MSNYQPQGTPTGSLINQGFTGIPPASGSVDASLLNQQQKYAILCSQFIASKKFFRGGVDVTNQTQVVLNALSQSVPMTTASATAYFSGITPGYWSSGVVDWLAGYNVLLNFQFV